MEVKIKKLDSSAIIPKATTMGSAGADLAALHDITLVPGETRLVKTGLALAVPVGYVGMVCSRSGLALKKSVFVLNAPGIVDSDYRGDVGVILHNASLVTFHIVAGDRVAQLLLVPVTAMDFTEVDELDETERGEGGFGSTGISQ